MNDVKATLDRFYQAWADQDADAIAELYLEDASAVLPGVLRQGRETLRGYFKGAFEGPLKGSRGIDDPIEIRMLGDDSAVVISKAGILMAGQEQMPAELEVHATWVLHRQDGEWRIAAYANAPVH